MSLQASSLAVPFLGSFHELQVWDHAGVPIVPFAPPIGFIRLYGCAFFFFWFGLVWTLSCKILWSSGPVGSHVFSRSPSVWHICLISIYWKKLWTTIEQMDEMGISCLSYKVILAAGCNLFHCKTLWTQVDTQKTTTSFAWHNLKGHQSLKYYIFLSSSFLSVIYAKNMNWISISSWPWEGHKLLSELYISAAKLWLWYIVVMIISKNWVLWEQKWVITNSVSGFPNEKQVLEW